MVDELKERLNASEHFLFQKFKQLIMDHLPDEFWEAPDDLYPYDSVFPPVKRENLVWCLRRVYDSRSGYLHAGGMYPRYIEFGLQATHPIDVVQSTLDIRGADRYLPPFSWFERLTHLVLVEYARRSFAPELVAARKAQLAEKKRLLEIVANLPESVRKDLEQLVQWTARFLGMAVINPLAPDREWSRDPETPSALLDAGLIGSEREGIERVSWLKNRDVGEAVGEFFFGAAKNPFRGNELLLPRGRDAVTPGKDAAQSTTGAQG